MSASRRVVSSRAVAESENMEKTSLGTWRIAREAEKSPTTAADVEADSNLFMFLDEAFVASSAWTRLNKNPPSIASVVALAAATAAPCGGCGRSSTVVESVSGGSLFMALKTVIRLRLE